MNFIGYWHHALAFARTHGVDPYVFGMLYAIHHPLFWGTMGWLVARVKGRRPIANQIVLGVIFWTMPYAYLLVFGKGLPLWMYIAACVFLIAGGIHVAGEIRRRIAHARLEPAPAVDRDA